MTAVPSTDSQTSIDPELTRILIVEDDRNVAKALASLLRSAKYSTEVSLCGADAMAYVEENPVAGAVIDIHLPDINGLVLSRQLRERLGPDKPIIVLSGDTSMEVINSLPHVGATYFFSKPVNAGHFLEHLRKALAQK